MFISFTTFQCKPSKPTASALIFLKPVCACSIFRCTKGRGREGSARYRPSGIPSGWEKTRVDWYLLLAGRVGVRCAQTPATNTHKSMHCSSTPVSLPLALAWSVVLLPQVAQYRKNKLVWAMMAYVQVTKPHYRARDLILALKISLCNTGRKKAEMISFWMMMGDIVSFLLGY